MSELVTRSPRLPPELIKNIGEILIQDENHKTAATLMRCSWSYYDLLCPVFYSRVKITRDNAPYLFVGLKLPPWLAPAATDPPPSTGRELWPEGRLPTEEELHANDESTVKTHQLYPHTTQTHHRKLKCLAYTRLLVIKEVPPIALCNALGRLYGVRKLHSQKESYPFTRIFEDLHRLVISSETTWNLADWHNRHSVPSNPYHPQPHPFATWLGLECNPRKVHMNYPTLTRSVRDDWIIARMGPRELVDAGEGSRIQSIRLQHHWMSFVYGGFWGSLLGMVMKWRAEDLFQMNVVGCPPLASPSRISYIGFQGCQCCISDQDEGDCPDHLDAPKRARRVLRMLDSMRHTTSITLNPTGFVMVDIGKVGGRGSEEEKEREIREMIKEGMRDWETSYTIDYVRKGQYRGEGGEAQVAKGDMHGT